MGQPMIEIKPDWERAAELGIETDDLGYAIWAFSDGAFVDEFFLGDDKIDMFIYSTRGAIEGPEDIGNLCVFLASDEGSHISGEVIHVRSAVAAEPTPYYIYGSQR